MGFKLENTSIKNARKQSAFADNIMTREIKLFGLTFSNKVKENFYVELSVLLKAGINLKESLELLVNSQNKSQPKEVFSALLNAIISGESLSGAMKQSNKFTSYEFYSIRIGEETGTLQQVTSQLGSFYATKNEQHRTIISALTYPIIILTTAILVLFFVLHFVVPMFEDIYEQQHIELPAITKAIIAISKFLETYGLVLIIGLIMMIMLSKMMSNKNWYKKYKDLILMRLPIFGKFIKIVHLSQFTQAITLLTTSKIPVVNSIQLVKDMVTFYPLQQALWEVEKSILIGNSLSASLSKHSLFDAKMVALVKVAEETNQNEFIFERLNDQYTAQVQQRSKLLTSALEPFIITIVGVIVGIILIAMYLPMFKLSSVLG